MHAAVSPRASGTTVIATVIARRAITERGLLDRGHADKADDFVKMAARRPCADDAKAYCPDERALWVAEGEGTRNVLSIVESSRFVGFDVLIEGWRDTSLMWRVAGEISCASGYVTCHASLPNLLGSTDPAEKL